MKKNNPIDTFITIANVTVTNVRSYFPYFTDTLITDSVIVQALTFAQYMFDGDCLDNKGQETAFMYLTAHYIVKILPTFTDNPLYAGDGNNHPTHKFHEGSLEETVELTDIDNSFVLSSINTTAYGCLYLQLTNVCRISPPKYVA